MIPNLKGSYLFVEIWVLFNLIISLGSILIIKWFNVPYWIAFSILIYSFIRILELTVYQINVLLFDPYNYNNYSVKSYRRLVILLLHNYVEVIFWFASSYMVLSETFGITVSKGTVTDTLLFSFLTMVTFGANTVANIQHIGHFIIFTQAIIGLFMTIVSLARFVSLLPRPNSQDAQENEKEQLERDILHLKTEISILNNELSQFKLSQRYKKSMND